MTIQVIDVESMQKFSADEVRPLSFISLRVW